MLTCHPHRYHRITIIFIFCPVILGAQSCTCQDCSNQISDECYDTEGSCYPNISCNKNMPFFKTLISILHNTQNGKHLKNIFLFNANYIFQIIGISIILYKVVFHGILCPIKILVPLKYWNTETY